MPMGGKFLPRNTEKVSLDILLKINNIQVVKEMILTYDALFIANRLRNLGLMLAHKRDKPPMA